MQASTALSFLLLLFCNCQAESSDDYVLNGSPSYAIAGDTPKRSAVLECVLNGVVEISGLEYVWFSDKDLTGKRLETIGTATLIQKGRLESRLDTADNGLMKMVLTIHAVEVYDEGDYTCEMYSGAFLGSMVKGKVKLHVNSLPAVSLVNIQTLVQAGNRVTIASCHADFSKPAPEMRFQDSYGKSIEGDDPIVECNDDSSKTSDCSGSKNYTIYLEKTVEISDADDDFFCVVKHVNDTEIYSKKVAKLDVQFPPSAEFLEESWGNSLVIRQEGEVFTASCSVLGNPTPDVTWEFTPDNAPPPNVTIPEPGEIPTNFIIVEESHTIMTESLVITEGATTNNGTFTCHASNGIAPDVAVSFQLQVSERSTTPAPTTAELPTEPLPLQVGADAAVIGGVVAVAVFVLIVTIILLLRYFMAHKGEYYTNELKATDDLRAELTDDDEDELPRTEADLLGEKKRTEHFM